MPSRIPPSGLLLMGVISRPSCDKLRLDRAEEEDPVTRARWSSVAGRPPTKFATSGATPAPPVRLHDNFGPSVQIKGTAEIVALPQAMDGLIDYYLQQRASRLGRLPARHGR